MSEVKEKLGKLSLTNQYQVNFSSLNQTVLDYLQTLGIDNAKNFLSRDLGIYCSEASLPASAFATGEVKDNFMGIPQEFAHTRLYTDIDFSFYIDSDYTNLRIFEGWMDFISSGSIGEIGELTDNYYKRYRYPDEYKVQTMFISKFEKNIGSQIDYQFINTFPKTMTTIPVSYGDAELLKVNVTFNYDRYVVNPKGSFTSSNLSTFSDVERTLFRSFDRISSYASNSRKAIPIPDFDSNKSDNADFDLTSFKDAMEAGEQFFKDNPEYLKYQSLGKDLKIDFSKSDVPSKVSIKDSFTLTDELYPNKYKDLGKDLNIDFNYKNDKSGLSIKDSFGATGGGKQASDNNQKISEEKQMSGLRAVYEIVNPFSDFNKEQRSKKSKATSGGDNKIGSDPTKDHRLGEDSKGKYRINSRGRKVYY